MSRQYCWTNQLFPGDKCCQHARINFSLPRFSLWKITGWTQPLHLWTLLHVLLHQQWSAASFLPQMGLHPSSSHVLWDVTPGLADPVVLPSVNFSQAYSPPEQTTVTNFIIPPVEVRLIFLWLAPLSVSAVDFANQPLVPSSRLQSATSSSDDLTPENGNQPVSDAGCDSRLLQESDLCSSSRLTDSPHDVVSPFWLDLLLDTNVNLCFPDANLVNIVLPP